MSGIRRLRQMTRRLGQLAERDVGLLFTATTIGDRLSFIALAFAVLEFGSATDPGLVLAAGRSSFAVMLGCLALIVALPSVRAIRAAPPEVTAAPPVTAV